MLWRKGLQKREVGNRIEVTYLLPQSLLWPKGISHTEKKLSGGNLTHLMLILRYTNVLKYCFPRRQESEKKKVSDYGCWCLYIFFFLKSTCSSIFFFFSFASKNKILADHVNFWTGLKVRTCKLKQSYFCKSLAFKACEFYPSLINVSVKIVTSGICQGLFHTV